jgi:hypothetical protein
MRLYDPQCLRGPTTGKSASPNSAGRTGTRPPDARTLGVRARGDGNALPTIRRSGISFCFFLRRLKSPPDRTEKSIDDIGRFSRGQDFSRLISRPFLGERPHSLDAGLHSAAVIFLEFHPAGELSGDRPRLSARVVTGSAVRLVSPHTQAIVVALAYFSGSNSRVRHGQLSFTSGSAERGCRRARCSFRSYS